MRSFLVLLLAGTLFQVRAQEPSTANRETLPASTRALLDGVKGAQSKSVIKSVLMIVCGKDHMKGTGFALNKGGVITTNSHVVGTCQAGELRGVSAVMNEQVRFTRMQTDSNRDLALLCPEKPLPFSLELNGDANPTVGTEVETWGYPLRYQDPAPILSRGYIAGFTVGKDANGQPKQPIVKHLIVNGAFNPGNSGGPLIGRVSGRVIGIVVEKWFLFSPQIENVISGLEQSKTYTIGGMQTIDGSGKPLSNEQGVALALKQVYDTSQVMVGEAISVSELNAFIREKRKDLACQPR